MIDIKSKQACCGCGSCSASCPQSCISMMPDEEGFLYPLVKTEKCVNCGICESVCPVLNKPKPLGAPEAYAATCKDEKIRVASSSGGMFTLLAEHVLEKGGVVFGAAFNEKFAVVHTVVETLNELCKLRGSKYVQSEIGDEYRRAKMFLEDGRPVLFTGTPCQIAGLKSYLNKDYSNLICQDIICHGVPSPSVWEKYLSYRENKAGAKIHKIFFRNKSSGWVSYSIQFTFQNGKEYVEKYNRDLYMKGFLENICLRPSCYDCAFKDMSSVSDITLADFWGVDNVVPEMDDNMGTSLVIINSKKGRELFNTLSLDINCKAVDFEAAIKYNPAKIESSIVHKNRNAFMKNFQFMPFDRAIKKYCSNNSFVLRIFRKLKRLLTKNT